VIEAQEADITYQVHGLTMTNRTTTDHLSQR
jgi:hypothetical protein